MSNEKIIKQWFSYAARDLRAAKAIRALGSDYKYIVAFNCQQSAEKAIKGYLVFIGIRPPRTHSIKSLAELLLEKDKALSLKLKKADVLTKYAVGYRYPDAEKKPLTLRQADSAIKIAQKTYEALLKLTRND